MTQSGYIFHRVSCFKKKEKERKKQPHLWENVLRRRGQLTREKEYLPGHWKDYFFKNLSCRRIIWQCMYLFNCFHFFFTFSQEFQVGSFTHSSLVKCLWLKNVHMTLTWVWPSLISLTYVMQLKTIYYILYILLFLFWDWNSETVF